MNFSDFFESSTQLCCISPDGLKFATAVHGKVMIRDVNTMKLVRKLNCLHIVQYLEWSPDSTMILCGMFKRSLIQVWLINSPDWTCKIDEGSAGLIGVRWSPDSRHILSTNDFHLTITIWSLVTKSISYIKYPKNCTKYIDFTKDGKYLAVAERRDCKDHVSIFECSNWSTVKHFCPDMENMDGICWSPSQNILCVWESCLRYKVLLYSLDGHCLSTYSAYDHALGIKSLTWSPSSQLLAVGSFDGSVRLLNHLTWRLVEEFSHMERPDDDVLIYREILVSSITNIKKSSSCYKMSSPQEFHKLATKSNLPCAGVSTPKIGVGTILFSPDSRYMASLDDSTPSCVWIWSIMTFKCCALLIQDKPIKSMAWDPVRPRLALCTGSPSVFIWTPEEAISVLVPCKDDENFLVMGVKWSPIDGSRLALIGQQQMCWCFTPYE